MGDMIPTFFDTNESTLDTTERKFQNLNPNYNNERYTRFQSSNLTVTSNKNRTQNVSKNLIKFQKVNIEKMLTLIFEAIDDINNTKNAQNVNEHKKNLDELIDQYNFYGDIYAELDIDDHNLDELFDEIEFKIEKCQNEIDIFPEVEPEPFEYSIKSTSTKPLTPKQLARIEKEKLQYEKEAAEQMKREQNIAGRERLAKAMNQMQNYSKKNKNNIVVNDEA